MTALLIEPITGLTTEVIPTESDIAEIAELTDATFAEAEAALADAIADGADTDLDPAEVDAIKAQYPQLFVA